VGKLVIVAIGGNSLVKDNGRDSVQDQYEAVCETAVNIADMVEEGFNVVVTNGNGPQVGFGLRRSEFANEIASMPAIPLVNCVADTQGGIGYQIQQALTMNLLKKELIKKLQLLLRRLKLVSMILILRIQQSLLVHSLQSSRQKK
jgi:carbamate kinase